jgi:hypothetical protein
MSRHEKAAPREGAAEKTSRVLRNVNVIGAAALAGVAVLAPPLAVVAGPLAGINALQAGGFEAARRHFQKKRTNHR